MLINGKEYEINRKTAKISEWDRVYCNLLKKIVENGILTENRTGVDTYSIPNFYFELDTGKSLPILESKKVFVRNAISEIQWIHQVQSNDVRWLHERKNPIWDAWMVDKDGIYRVYEPNISKENADPEKEVEVVDVDGKKLGITAKSLYEDKTIRSAKYFGEEYAETIALAYGGVNAITKQPQSVEWKLKNNPTDRRMIINLHQAEFLKKGTLEPCVWSSEWRVLNGKLYTNVHQRSADTPVGLPFNVTQYAVMQAMMANANGLDVGTLGWSITDAHIYVDQMEGIKKQLKRFEMMEKIEKFIANTGDSFIEREYLMLKEDEKKLEYFLNYKGTDDIKEELDNIREFIKIFELMITKEKPVLELAKHDSFFDYSTDYNLDKEYLKNNPTGNEDIKILKYKSLSKIDFPVAQ